MDQCESMGPQELLGAFSRHLGAGVHQPDGMRAMAIAGPVLCLWCFLRDDEQIMGDAHCLAAATTYAEPGHIERLIGRHDIPREILARVELPLWDGLSGRELRAQGLPEWDQDLHPRLFVPFALSLRGRIR